MIGIPVGEAPIRMFTPGAVISGFTTLKSLLGPRELKSAVFALNIDPGGLMRMGKLEIVPTGGSPVAEPGIKLIRYWASAGAMLAAGIVVVIAVGFSTEER